MRLGDSVVGLPLIGGGAGSGVRIRVGDAFSVPVPFTIMQQLSQGQYNTELSKPVEPVCFVRAST
jgi:hypothetical protein